MTAVHFVVTYDIADDERREDVSTYLSGFGPRVQLSVFEVQLRDAAASDEFRTRLQQLIDVDEDQIRLYRLTRPELDRTTVYGSRTIEERVDYWIV